jgi:hypothetical protein
MLPRPTERGEVSPEKILRDSGQRRMKISAFAHVLFIVK